MRLELRGWLWFCAPACAFVVVVYLVPLGLLFANSFTQPQLGFANYGELFGSIGYLRTILRTLEISAIATILALVLGYPLAYAIATAGARWRLFLTLCVITPYVTSTLVRSFAWLVILGRDGPLNRLVEALGLGSHELLFTPFAVAIGLTHYLLPLMVLPLVSVMSQVPGNLVPAAESLGAGPAVAWFRVYLPQTRSGIEAGVVLCFVYGVGSFVIPSILGGNAGQMIGDSIQSAIMQRADYGFASAAAALLTACVVVILLLYTRWFGGSLETLAAPASAVAGDSRQHLRASVPAMTRLLTASLRRLDASGLSRKRWLLDAWSIGVGLFLLVPQFIAIPVSFSSSRAMVVPPPGWSLQWYQNLATQAWSRPFLTSIEVAIVVALLATVLGALAAIGVARSRGTLSNVAHSLMLLPLLFPTVVAAAALFITFFPLYLTDSRLGLMLAHTTLALPFAFIVILASARKLDLRLDDAAASLGAGAWKRLSRITLPLLQTSLVVTLFLAFMTSFDETAVAIFLSGVHVSTLPVQMYNSLTIESDPTIAAAAVVIMIIAGLGLGFAPALRTTAGRGLRLTGGRILK